MKRTFDWNNVNLFIIIARNGGLAGASADTNISPATLSRKMTNLEHALEVRLFKRGARGYDLTVAGESLYIFAKKMEESASLIENWRVSSSDIRQVKISAGAWTMQLLLKNLNKYWQDTDNWKPEFISNSAKLDIARRQIDIGIRNKRPKEPWLAGQHIGDTRYASYRLKDCSNNLGWVGVTDDSILTPTARWTKKHYKNDIIFTVSSPTLGLPLVLNGNAQMIMPEFIGHTHTELVRNSDFISELQSELWLVMHQDERNHPPIRAAINQISNFLKNDYVANA